MSDQGPQSQNQGLPGEMTVEPARRSLFRNLSPIWLVPVAAVGLVGYFGWQSYSSRGTLVEISFQNAAGIVPGATTVRLRDVVIGSVERVDFTSDLQSVVVSARLTQGLAEQLPEDAQFWVVRPEVSTRGISGLDTVLSGSYIAAAWEPSPGAAADSFVGLEEAPAIVPGERGRRITIRARDGNQISAGAPVFFRGIEVGRLEKPRLNSDGTVSVTAFIQAPNDARLTTASRFWDMSGFSVSFGTGGLTLNVASLGALVSGGVAFDNVFSGGQPLPDGFAFDLFPDEPAARDSVFSQVGANAVSFRVEFEGSINGLTAGAPVMYRGLKVGEVESIGAYVQQTGARSSVRLQAIISIDPQSMGLPQGAGSDELIDLLSARVAEDGMRVRLASQNLFSSSLMIQLVEEEGAEPATIQTPADGLPVLPSTASDVADVAATAEGVLRRVNSLPIEELLGQATRTMAAIEAFAASADTQAVPMNLNSLLTEARGLVGSPDAQALPSEIRSALAELQSAATEIKTLVAGLNEADLAGRLGSALDQVSAAAEGIAGTAEGLPALVEEIRAVAAKANALPLEMLLASGTELSDQIKAFVARQETQDIPVRLNAALQEVEAAVAELRAGGTADRLVDALASASAAADGVTLAVRDVPLLVEDLRAVARKADELPLEQMVDAATRALEGLEGVVGSQGARDLPPAMTAALQELSAILTELRETRTVDKLVDALDAAYDAAITVDAAGDGVPLLIEDLRLVVQKIERMDLEGVVAEVQNVLSSADALIGSDDTKELPAALTGALQEVRDTLAEVRAGGLIENANGTLASARSAADSVAEAARTLPALGDRLQGIAGQAEALIAAYGARSDANRELLSALREIREAGRSISELARTLQRNPSAIIRGR